jgi:hypothetical protein
MLSFKDPVEPEYTIRHEQDGNQISHGRAEILYKRVAQHSDPERNIKNSHDRSEIIQDPGYFLFTLYIYFFPVQQHIHINWQV